MEEKRNSALTTKVNVPKLNPQNENVNILNNRGNWLALCSVVHKTESGAATGPYVWASAHGRNAWSLVVCRTLRGF